MSQTNQILNHLRGGKPLTPQQALQRFGCFRLAARIQNLRDKGHKIEAELVQKDGKRFARYRLVA